MRSPTRIPFILAVLFALVAPMPPTVVADGVGEQGLSVKSCESAEACFRRAVATLATPSDSPLAGGHSTDQIKQLRAVMDRFPETIWAKRARLGVGARLREHEPSEAVELLGKSDHDVPLLRDYARLWRAQALVNDGQMAGAAALFESIPKAEPSTLLKREASFGAGEAWYFADRCPKAIRHLRRAVALDQDDAKVPASLLRLADCQIREIQTAEGLATLTKVWARYPESDEAVEALARLHARAPEGVWLAGPDALYERAGAFLDRARYKAAIRELEKFLLITSDHPKRDRARLRLGLAHARLKQYPKAQRIYQELVNERSPVSGEAVVWLARIFVRQGTGDKLLALPDILSDLPLSAEERATVYLFVGVWLEDQSRHEEAIAAYGKSQQAGRGTSLRPKALWRIGWVQYRSGRHREAVETFEKGLDAQEAEPWRPKLLYWMAQAQERLADAQSTTVYERLCGDYPLTYYGKLVSSCAGTFVRAMAPEGAVVPATAQGPALTQLRKKLHYRKATALQELGFQEDAVRELTWLAQRGTGSRLVLLELSKMLSESGGVHEALRVAKIYFRDYLEGARQVTSPTLWQVAYPTRYLPVIETYAEDPLDPFLVAAIIREESLYDHQALSSAGAVGLMQIMPATARTLVKGGDLDYLREQLFERRTNIRLGSLYLGNLLRQFSGNVIHAVAAYNAGPIAVSSWIRRNGHTDPVEFVELIPYRETRGYVKRVLRSYREYYRLERGHCGASSLDKAC